MKVHRKKPRQGQTGEWWIVFTEYCVLTLTPEQDPVPIQGLPPPVSEESVRGRCLFSPIPGVNRSVRILNLQKEMIRKFQRG